MDSLLCSVPVVLVGNKTDLQKERVISTEEGKRVAETWGAMFIETTAKRRDVSIQNNVFQ